MSGVRGCARCGLDHDGIDWRPLTRPVVDDDGTTWTHWAPCPGNGEPILMRRAATSTAPGSAANPIVVTTDMRVEP